MAWSSRVILVAAAVYAGVFGVIWFIRPMRALASGFLLGGLISLYNIFHLSFRLRIAGLRVLSGSRMPAGLHMTVRILTVIFGTLLVYRFPALIDFRSFVLSLLFGYILLVTVMSFYYLRKTTSSDEGGETLGSDSESNISRDDV
ncbi:hypothetical protein GCM10007968_13170 [Sporolactobacillus putidus]|uniref:ATP synthase I chain n=2 Tax=Sporolactobacillus putidus TaxID=492735 RepID=A0A917VZQ1_9BACL|nr:hypothetical protein GCM10007968_13170 [Sporolactobacillus putidus]